MSEYGSTTQTVRDRPGCVTAYAILSWISAALALIGMVVLVFTGGIGIGVAELLCLGVLFLMVAFIPAAIGLGLWRMEKWGWALVVISHVLSLLVNLMALALNVLILLASGGETPTRMFSATCGVVVSLIFNGVILYWFISNRELFDGGDKYRVVIGPDGEQTMEPVEKKDSNAAAILAIVVGLGLAAILICIVIFALLALLGPQIGNVFSQITDVLENPPPAVIPVIW